jgi:hypothetical protein
MAARVLLLTIAAWIASGTVYAHHSFAGYLAQKTVTIQAEVVQYSLRNPHTTLEVVVKGENAPPEKWIIEWGSVEQLGRGGAVKGTLKAGDRVVITGNPHVNRDHRLRLLKIERPSDGWTWRGEGAYVG